MEIIQAQDQTKWDQWLETVKNSSHFTQSWAWGDILIKQGQKVERLQLVDNHKVIGQAQIVYSQLPFGWRYAVCPKGPNLSAKLIDKLVEYLTKQGVIFFRVEPSQKIEKTKKTIDINPRATVILDLNKSKQDLLKEMKSKTRYNIRLAQKKSIKIIDVKDVAQFLCLSETTAKRDGFKLHHPKRYQAVLENENSYQLSAMVDNKIIASGVFVGFGNTFTYLYGASGYQHRRLMAPHLLQWQAIKLAKEKGYKYYDFFGIAPAIGDKDKYKYDSKHQYAGVTRFKLGFGGQVVEQPGTFDLVIDPTKYIFYKILRKVRRIF